VPRLLPIVMSWAADPHPLVRRAAAAAVCEPRLLTGPGRGVCDRGVPVRRRGWPGYLQADAGILGLRQALG
jgi:hypothetical protein